MIDVMQGDKFGFAVIATPYTAAATDEHFSYAKQGAIPFSTPNPPAEAAATAIT